MHNSFSRARRFAGLAAIAASLALGACASQVMKEYVGSPVNAVILDYGPPDNIIDLASGERAYQWQREKTQAVAGQSSGEFRKTRRGERYEEMSTPGYVETTQCFYTFYARSRGGEWYVTNIRQPKLECE